MGSAWQERLNYGWCIQMRNISMLWGPLIDIEKAFQKRWQSIKYLSSIIYTRSLDQQEMPPNWWNYQELHKIPRALDRRVSKANCDRMTPQKAKKLPSRYKRKPHYSHDIETLVSSIKRTRVLNSTTKYATNYLQWMQRKQEMEMQLTVKITQL